MHIQRNSDIFEGVLMYNPRKEVNTNVASIFVQCRTRDGVTAAAACWTTPL